MVADMNMNPIAGSSDGGEAFARAVARAKAEYLEMPGLKLTVEQATRLWAFDLALCHSVLRTLVDSRFLVQTKNASFARSE